MRGIIGLKQARRNEQLSDIVGPDGLFLGFFLSLCCSDTNNHQRNRVVVCNVSHLFPLLQRECLGAPSVAPRNKNPPCRDVSRA